LSQRLADIAAETVTVAPYEERLQAAHERFVGRMWPSKRRRRDARFIRWKFRGPVQGAVNGLLLAVSGNEVVGQLGLIPASLRIDGERVACQWACDLMVDATLRRRGIASLLFDAALARGIVTLGSNPSTAADVTMQRIGFRSLDGPAMAVFPLRPAHVVSWKMPARFAPANGVVGAVLRPFFRWRGRRLYADGGHRQEAVKRGPWRTVAGLVAEQQGRQTEPLIVHDEEFLDWRCEGLSGFADPLVALHMQKGSYAIVGAARPYFYVFDWFAWSWDEFIGLFSTIRAMASEARAMTLEAYAQVPEERSWLRRAGFLFMRHPCKILCHPPARFLPRHPRMRYSIIDSDGNL
jgi:GNAT superfamily N-acetyltransferase